MNIYRISRPCDVEYDEYEGAVVIARSARDATKIHPNAMLSDEWDGIEVIGGWISSEEVVVTYFGKASPRALRGIILSSFHAG